MFNQLVYITIYTSKLALDDFDQSFLNDLDQSVYTCIIKIRRYNVLFNIIGGFDRKMNIFFSKYTSSKQNDLS